MTRKDFTTKFMELINTTTIGGNTCYMTLYKYPSGRFCLSFDSYHSKQRYVHVQGSDLASMMTRALKEIAHCNHRQEMQDIFNGKESLKRPEGYALSAEQIGIVSKELKTLRKLKAKKIISE
jgi:hypothetical protein